MCGPPALLATGCRGLDVHAKRRIRAGILFRPDRRPGQDARSRRYRGQRPADMHQRIAGDEIRRAVRRCGQVPAAFYLQARVGDLRLVRLGIVGPGRQLVPAPQDPGLGDPQRHPEGQHDLLAAVVGTQLRDLPDDQVPYRPADHGPAGQYGHRDVLQLAGRRQIDQVAAVTGPDQPDRIGDPRQVHLGVLDRERMPWRQTRRRARQTRLRARLRVVRGHRVDPHLAARRRVPAQHGATRGGGDLQITDRRWTRYHRRHGRRPARTRGNSVRVMELDVDLVTVCDTCLDGGVDVLTGVRPGPPRRKPHRRRFVHGPLDRDRVHRTVQAPGQLHRVTDLLRAQLSDVPHDHEPGCAYRYRPSAAGDRGHLVADHHSHRHPGVDEIRGPGGAQAVFRRDHPLRVARVPEQADHPVGHRGGAGQGGAPPQDHPAVLLGRGQVPGWLEGQRGQRRQRLAAVGRRGEHRGQGVLLVGGGQLPGRGDPAVDDVLMGDEFGEHLLGGAPVRAGHVAGVGDQPPCPVGGGIRAPGLTVVHQRPPAGVGGGQRRLHPRAEFFGLPRGGTVEQRQHRAGGGQQLAGIANPAGVQRPTDGEHRLGGLPRLAHAPPAGAAGHRGGLGLPPARGARGVQLGVAVTADPRAVHRLWTATLRTHHVVEEDPGRHGRAQLPGDAEQQGLGLCRGQARPTRQDLPYQPLERGRSQFAVENDVLLDPSPDLLPGVRDQAGGIGGRIPVQQPGAHLREQIRDHRLLTVVRTPLVAFQRDLVGRPDPFRRRVGRNAQEGPQGGGGGPVADP